MSASHPPSSLPRIGVGVIVWKHDQVLLGERLSEASPCWQFPGGHLEAGETVLQCAARELMEETGLQACALQPATYSNQLFRMQGKDYLTLYVSARWQSGEPERMEPHKCAAWRWFDYRELPAPLFAPITHLLQQCGDLRAACQAAGIPAGEHR